MDDVIHTAEPELLPVRISENSRPEYLSVEQPTIAPVASGVIRMAGRRFSSWIAVEYWWRLESFSFLKGRSRAISLIDYEDEKEFVDKVPHRVLFSSVAGVDTKSLNHNSEGPLRRRSRPSDCPF
jgi:hypothetical protein